MCEFIRRAQGVRAGTEYILAKITPPLMTRIQDGPISEYDHIILAIVGEHAELHIGKSPVLADIVIFRNRPSDVIDERECSRIGVGTLHATYAEALAGSPMERGG